MIDLNDAEAQREGGLIPDGTFAKIMMSLRPGGSDIPGLDQMDLGLFKASASSDVMMLDCEFTVMQGPFAKRKFWQMFTVAGGKTDEKGRSMGFNISKSTIRAMIESAIGLSPERRSQEQAHLPGVQATRRPSVLRQDRRRTGQRIRRQVGHQENRQRQEQDRARRHRQGQGIRGPRGRSGSLGGTRCC